MRTKQSFFWQWPMFFMLAAVASIMLLQHMVKVQRIRAEIARAQEFQMTGNSFRFSEGIQSDLQFRIEQPLAGHGLLLSLRQEVPQFQRASGKLAEEMQDLQKEWGNLAGTANVFTSDGRPVASASLRLQHSLMRDADSNLLPLAQLPMLPPGNYQLRVKFLTPPQKSDLPEVSLHLSCGVCTLEYLPLYLNWCIILLLIPFSLFFWYRLIECVFWFKRQREQEKWLSEGVGQSQIMYVMTRYPLWSETFLRQDLQFLLKEGVPLEPVALFPGDCTAQPDWPAVRILSPEVIPIATSGKGGSWWRKLRCLIPARVQCSLVWFRHRRLLRELFRQGKLCHARHIHAEFADLGALLAAVAARYLGVGFSLGVHAADVYTNRYSLDYLCRKAKFITVCNRAAGAYLARKCPIAAKKLHLIHHGLTIEDWPFREKQTFQEVPELLFVGRFVAKKGIPLLLEALALLLQRGRRLRLTLVGSGPMEAELRQQSEQLELQAHLEWAGVLERREVGGRLRKADVFCLPSIEQTDRNQEGIPNVLVEAMAVGVPVVGSQTGGIGELLTPQTGWPIEKISAEIFADTIEEMLQNPAECEKRRRQARQRVEAEFSAARTVKARARLLEGF